jgi:hypothetical protein
MEPTPTLARPSVHKTIFDPGTPEASAQEAKMAGPEIKF